jgi:hypothetical protein
MFGRDIQWGTISYHIHSFRECYKRAIEEGKKEGTCLKGKLLLDEIFADHFYYYLNNSPNYDLLLCRFKYDGNTATVCGEQACRDFYANHSNDIYNTAEEFSVTYFFKAKEDLNQLSKVEEICSIPQIENPILEAVQTFNFIKHKYQTSNPVDRYYISKLPLSEVIKHYLEKGNLCPRLDLKEKYVVGCHTPEGKTYGLNNCYSKVSYFKFWGFQMLDQVIYQINEQLENLNYLMHSTNNQKNTQMVTVYSYCSPDFDLNEEISTEYSNYLLLGSSDILYPLH